ncbi:MAG: hypothetical protein JWN27_3761 [Candidatus Eremiobacteraeota bacterium]|nr:hypothetical protein [Candidatus Eremiobacteraeota bacterium]
MSEERLKSGRATRRLASRRIACALLSCAIVACSPAGDRVAASLLESDLTEKYHECVPLGWTLGLTTSSYYPGYNATTTEEGVWLPALWIAVIPKRDFRRPSARTVRAILDELTSLGLLKRIDLRDRLRYHLSERGSRYFYNENRLGDNSEHWPYMCYSRIVPLQIVWRAPSRRNDGVERVAYVWWRAMPPQPWVTPFLRAHSVVLNPTQEPAVATVFVRTDRSIAAKLVFSLPSVVDRSAWR